MTNNVQLLAFDVRATRRAVTVENVDVTLTTTVQVDETLVAPVAKLYRGTTLVGSATVLANGVVNFDRMEALIERDSTATFTVRVNLNRLVAGTTYAAGTTIGATVTAVRGTDAGDNTVAAGTGTPPVVNIAGNVARLFTVAPSWALVGTPTISQVVVGTGAQRDANAQIVVDITALGGDIYIRNANGVLGAITGGIRATTAASATVVIPAVVAGTALATDGALNIDGIPITLVATDTTAALIGDRIRTVINAAGGRTVDVGGTGATLTFTRRVAGSAGNITLPATDLAVDIATAPNVRVTIPTITMTGGIDGAALTQNMTAASITATDGTNGHLVQEGTTRRFTVTGSLSRGAGALPSSGFAGMRISQIVWETTDALLGTAPITSTFGLTPLETGSVLISN